MRAKIVVTNHSGTAVLGTVLQARFPTDGVNSLLQSVLSGGGTCPGGVCERGELVTWNIGSLGAGQGVEVSMPMQVTSGTVAGTVISMPVEVDAEGITQVLASTSVTVDNDNALSLALDEDKNAVAPGGALVYTLTYGNRSTASVTGATLSLPLPTGVDFVSASGGGTLVGNTVQWTLATLQASQSGRLQVSVTADVGLSNGTILAVDAAELSGTSAVTGPELARATAATRVQATPVLGLAIEMDPDPVRSNEGVRTKLTVTNHSGTAVLGTVLQARFPTDGVNSLLESVLSGGGTCPGGVCERYELVTWNLGTIAAGAGVTVMMPMQVTSGTGSGTLITLDAVVTADGVSQVQTSHTVAVDNDNALSLALDEDKDAVAPGGALAYTLTYGNRSTASVTGATLSLPLPTGVDFVSASGGGTLVGNTVQWTLATLQASQSGRQQVVVTADGGLSNGTILAVDAAELSGTSAVTGPELARAIAATRVQATPVLGLAIEMDPDPVRSNEGVRTKLTVTNHSGTTVLGTVLQARFPTDGVNSLLESVLSGGGTCPGGVCERYELVTWNLGTIAAGAGVTVMMPMQVTSGTGSGTLITMDAIVTGDGVSPGLLSHTAVVDNDNALSLALNENKDAVAPGGALTYTLTYGNRSTASVTGTKLSLPLPTGVDFVSASGGGTLVGNTVQWTLATLQANQSGRLQVSVTADAGLSNGTILAVDAAELSGTSAVTGPELALATAATRVFDGSPVMLSVGVSPNPIATNQTLTATLTVTNVGASSLTGTVLQARFPTDGVNSLLQSLLTGGGICPGGVCDRYELVTWNLGTIAAGAGVTVMMPMVVTSGVVSGTQFTVDGQVSSDSGDQATVSDTAAVGTGAF